MLIAAAAVEPPGRPMTSDLDWEKLLRLAAHHRLEGLLDAYLGRAGLPVPESVAERLRERRHRLAAAELTARAQLGQISATLQSAGVRSVPLKGAALVDSAYEEVGLRAVGDIDLLIAPETLKTALDALEVAGYQERLTIRPKRPGVEATEHHHHAPLRHPGHSLAVELHLRPVLSGRSQAAPVLAGAHLSPRGGCLLPDPSDHVVILAAHFITDREIGSRVALGQLADIARVASQARLDRAAARAADWGLTWETSAALHAVHLLGLRPTPDAEPDGLRSTSRRRRQTHALIRHRVLVDSAVSMTPRRSPPGLRASLIPSQGYLRACYAMPDASVPRVYIAHARALRRRARPLIMATLRHPRRSASEIILARRLRAR